MSSHAEIPHSWEITPVQLLGQKRALVKFNFREINYLCLTDNTLIDRPTNMFSERGIIEYKKWWRNSGHCSCWIIYYRVNMWLIHFSDVINSVIKMTLTKLFNFSKRERDQIWKFWWQHHADKWWTVESAYSISWGFRDQFYSFIKLKCDICSVKFKTCQPFKFTRYGESLIQERSISFTSYYFVD